MNIKYFKKIIVEEIRAYSGIDNIDCDENLLSLKYKFVARDILYIIYAIERTLGFEITDIFKNNDSNVMTVNNLASEINALWEQHESANI